MREGIVDVAVLGPLAVVENGSPLEVTGPKRRALLTLLALYAGTPVSRDRIVDALWPERATGREESTLRVHVSHLRDVLEAGRGAAAPQVIVTAGSAYMLGEGVEVDLTRFERLASEGRQLLAAHPEKALEVLNEALGLWRGRPLQDVEYEEFAQEAIRRLEAAREEAILNRAEALVELGEDAAAVEDLEALVRTEPTRERPVSLLMRALYRSGRQADALRVARRHARRLAERGLEASPRVAVLEEQILRHDPSLQPERTLSPAELAPGRSVRGYELREEAGSGSVGVVYRAFQASVGREVAIKVIHPRLAQTPEFVRRFAEEARVVASLEHPHIVPLYDFWREPAGAFLVMRWMDGASLAARVDRPWDEADLGRVFGQLADALGYAHSAGVVHRDLKPANVLFDEAGNAFLCDFGLAVTGIDTGVEAIGFPTSVRVPYASPELMRGEAPTVAADVFGLGVLLAEAASGQAFRHGDSPLAEGIREVVMVATANDPADRYPDMGAFRAALLDALGAAVVPLPRRVRRNPYKGLSPFGEADRADFYGRDDLVETLVDMVDHNGLTAVIGASGSGKSSLVMAGLVPELRTGAIPGSDEWSIVSMVPGVDPFEEFHLGLRHAAVGYAGAPPGDPARELGDSFAGALDGPHSRALLIVDQFEEVFSSDVDQGTRQRFLANLTDLAEDAARRVRVVATLRADFSEQPLAHPRFGDLMARSSLLVAPMRPEQVEDVIRRPAARVGVQVEPGLVAEIVRDVASAPAYLPLLQYVLTELFERRTEDRLTVRAYRTLGGVQGVLERRAEAIHAGLGPTAQHACRQLFLRMVHLGDHGEETRRRLPLGELHGLGGRAAVDEALEAFAAARLLTYDRDPVTRTPTVEVAHETVIHRWARYQVWIDEARADVVAHRRLAAAAGTWASTGEDPAYLLTGGPLAAALEVASADRIGLNALEARFLTESRRAEEEARLADQERRRQEAALAQRARRRLQAGMGVAAVAVIVAVLAGVAFMERQRANDLAATAEGQNLARELAAAAVNSLADPDLALLLALAAADRNLEAGEAILPEVVDSLHRAAINPRPHLFIEGAGFGARGQAIDFSDDGELLVALAADGGAMVVDPRSGSVEGRTGSLTPPAAGVDFHADGRRVLVIHANGFHVWDWRRAVVEWEVPDLGAGAVITAVFSRDGSELAVGTDRGTILIWSVDEAELVSRFEGAHAGRVTSVDFDGAGRRLVSGGSDGQVRVWDLGRKVELAFEAPWQRLVLTPVSQVAWHPMGDAIAVTTGQGFMFGFDATTGHLLSVFGIGTEPSPSIAFSPYGVLVVAAGNDGATRIFSTWYGGEPAVVLPAGGVPGLDAAFHPTDAGTMATLGVDGLIRVWRAFLGSELPAEISWLHDPRIAVTPDGSRYALGGHNVWVGHPGDPSIRVVDSATSEVLLERATWKDWWLRRVPAISADGSAVAFVGPSKHVEVVDVESGASVQLSERGDWATSLAFGAGGALLAIGFFDGAVEVWDVTVPALIQTLTGHGDRRPHRSGLAEFSSDLGFLLPVSNSRVDRVVFHPERPELFSSGLDGTVRVWDLATGDGGVIHHGDYDIWSMALSPDGSRLAVSDRAGSVVLLDVDSGATIQLEGVSGRTEVAFSSDGRRLAGGGPGRLVHLWDLDTFRIIRRLSGAVVAPFSPAFTNGDSRLMAVGPEGILRGYLLDPLDLIDHVRGMATRQLTDEECELYLRRPCDG